jgi:hypothetical protein
MKDVLASSMLKFRTPYYNTQINYGLYQEFFDAAKSYGFDFIKATESKQYIPYLPDHHSTKLNGG